MSLLLAVVILQNVGDHIIELGNRIGLYSHNLLYTAQYADFAPKLN